MALSPILQITQVAPNQSAKEATINDGFVRLERALNDISTVNLASGNATLTLTDYTIPFLFKCTGHTVARDLTVPASKRLFGVYNGGTANVTVKISAGSGTNAVVPPSSFCILFNDTVDMRTISDSAASGVVTSLLDLPEVPSSFAGHAGEALIINGTEDGLTFGTITVGLEDLDDGPGTYTGAAGKAVVVNGTADGFVFATYVNEFKDLTDGPASYAGQSGKLVSVKSSEDGVEFVDPPEQFVFETRDYELTNPGFELGTTASWTLPGTGGTWAAANLFGDILPAEGSYLIYHGYGQGNVTSHLEYTVDLTTQGTTAELDADAQVNVVIAMASDNADIGYIVLEYINGSSVVISSDESDHYTSTDSFIDRTFRKTLPVGSRTLKVKLYAVSNASALIDPDSLAFAFDNLRVSLKLETTQVTAFTQLTDAPSAYGGQAGKVVQVNSGATALEFGGTHTYLGLSDTTDTTYTAKAGFVPVVNGTADGMELVALAFTSLADAPASLIGNAGQYVKVNDGETALEFAPPVNEVELAFFTPGVLVNSQTLLAYYPTKNIELPAGLTGSVCKAGVAATGSTVLDIKKNGTNVGTLTFAAAGTTATLAMASATTFTAVTDKLSIVGPASADATLADISGSLFGDVV